MSSYKRISLTEVYGIIKNNRDGISSESLAEYAVVAGNDPSAKRIGWILDALELPGKDRLKVSVKGASIPLDYSRSSSGNLDPEWGVKVNMEVDD